MTVLTEEQSQYQIDVAMAVVGAVVDVRAGVVDPDLVFEGISDAIAMISYNLGCFTTAREQRELAEDCRARIRWRMKRLQEQEAAGELDEWRRAVPVGPAN